LKRKRTFKKYSYRGVELDKLLDLKNEEFIDVSRRREGWGLICNEREKVLMVVCVPLHSSSTPERGEDSSEVSRGSLSD
jgi:hypothetical protein